MFLLVDPAGTSILIFYCTPLTEKYNVTNISEDSSLGRLERHLYGGEFVPTSYGYGRFSSCIVVAQTDFSIVGYRKNHLIIPFGERSWPGRPMLLILNRKDYARQLKQD